MLAWDVAGGRPSTTLGSVVVNETAIIARMGVSQTSEWGSGIAPVASAPSNAVKPATNAITSEYISICLLRRVFELTV
jgi:hypothetical protein